MTSPTGEEKTYTYDSWGNTITIGYEGSFEADSNVRTFTSASMTYDDSNRMLTYNGEDITYDDDGNMLYGPLDGVMTEFEYDCRNRLIRAGDTYYQYDAENVRTITETPEYREEYITESVSQFSRVLVITREYKTENKTDTEKYYYGNGLIYEKSSEVGVLVYHYNHLGSTTAVTDGEGNLVYSFDYGTYGELKSTTEYDNTAPVIRFLYNGQLGVMTDDNGLYYMRFRYYNPDIKRFINQDVLIGSIGNSNSLNRYSYVEGNPVSYIDPFGLSPYGNFGTFLNVMKFMSQIDIMSLVHVTLSALGALPGCTWLNFINAGLYLAEQNYSEMCKSLLFGVANLDWVTYVAKFAVKIGKYTEKLDKILKCIDLGLHLKACYESAVDFGTIAAGMIDKYLVNGEEVTWDIALEFLLLAGTGLQLGLLTHSLTGKLSTTFGGSSLDGGGVSSVTKNKHVLDAADGSKRNNNGIQKTYQTYTKTNTNTGEVYSGRTSGTDTPAENVRKRDANHHMNEKGFGPAVLDKTSDSYEAIRGREQMLIEHYGGAQSMGGSSGNAINGISPKNPKRDIYINAAKGAFGNIE